MDGLITEYASPEIWWTVKIKFCNPYKTPPHGWPRVIWAACCEHPDKIKDIYSKIHRPPGYSVACTYWKWIKVMKPEALVKMRQKRVESKIAKKTKGMLPFIAEEIRQKEWAKKPADYLDVEKCREHQQSRVDFQREWVTDLANKDSAELVKINSFPDLQHQMRK